VSSTPNAVMTSHNFVQCTVCVFVLPIVSDRSVPNFIVDDGDTDLDHTADVQIHSWGSTFAQCLEQLGLGMLSYMTNLENVDRETSSTVVHAEGVCIYAHITYHISHPPPLPPFISCVPFVLVFCNRS
jgi:hypothetical protein